MYRLATLAGILLFTTSANAAEVSKGVDFTQPIIGVDHKALKQQDSPDAKPYVVSRGMAVGLGLCRA